MVFTKVIISSFYKETELLQTGSMLWVLFKYIHFIPIIYVYTLSPIPCMSVYIKDAYDDSKVWNLWDKKIGNSKPN